MMITFASLAAGRPPIRVRGRSVGFWCTCLWTVWLAWAVAPVRAQDDQARARDLFARGVEGFERGDYARALSAFEHAYRLSPHPTVRVNMANCFEQLGRYPEAVFNYERFLQEGGEDISPEQRTEVEAAVRRLESKIGSLVVVTRPDDASLTVDGEPVVVRPEHPLRLSAGAHTLRASKPGYLSVERMIEVQGGAVRRISLELMREAPVAALPAAGPVEEPQEAEPWATAAPVEQSAQPGSDSKVLRRAMWSALASAALLGGGAAVTGVLAMRAESDFDDAVAQTHDASRDAQAQAQARSAGLDAAHRADVFATVTDVLTGAAAVSATAALVIWWVDRRRRPRDRTGFALTPVLDHKGAGHAVLRGAF